MYPWNVTHIGVRCKVVKRTILFYAKLGDNFAFQVLIFHTSSLQCSVFMVMCLRDDERVETEKCCQGGPGLPRKGLQAEARDPPCALDEHMGKVSSAPGRVEDPRCSRCDPSKELQCFQVCFCFCKATIRGRLLNRGWKEWQV